ncbi:MAG: response regulator transcription factor [Anaerolineales bacterium]|nr:response regulator transcription factor [Anaerolineales bacterium]
MEKIRVLLADDHELFREGLANVLNAQPDFEVIGEASDGLEVLVKARKLKPNLILMDIGMPRSDGVEATKRIKEEMPEIVIVMLTIRNEDEKLFEAIQTGAQGYLLKNIRSRDLMTMLRGVVQGEAAITPALGGRMLEEFRRLRRQSPKVPEDDSISLTNREQDVLSLVAQGATDKEIATQLFISIYTVKSHMRNILSKLHLGHRYEAAQYALREGLIKPSKE